MTYYDQWQSISVRIMGLGKAGQLNAKYLSVKNEDTYFRQKELHQQTLNACDSIDSYRKRFNHHLPLQVINAIDRFMEISLIKNRRKVEYKPNLGPHELWAILTMLLAFEAEVTYLLSDTEQRVRVLSERAFHHLNRSIVADESIRLKWKEAFKSGEVACEKLGAAHLLQHGIFAFKAHAAGERTDLIFQDNMTDSMDVSYAEGLVLTEWKKSHDNSQAKNLFLEARHQAKIYGNGSLSGIELSDYRYLVVVSEKNIEVPTPITENGVTYKHINIPVNPDPPSKASRA